MKRIYFLILILVMSTSNATDLIPFYGMHCISLSTGDEIVIYPKNKTLIEISVSRPNGNIIDDNLYQVETFRSQNGAVIYKGNSWVVDITISGLEQDYLGNAQVKYFNDVSDIDTIFEQCDVI